MLGFKSIASSKLHQKSCALSKCIIKYCIGRFLESSKNSRIKGSDILWSILVQLKVWSKNVSKKLKETINFIHHVACKYLHNKYLDIFYAEENWRRRLKSWRGNLLCLWDFWANRCSTFSWISYFILERRQMRYLDTYN